MAARGGVGAQIASRCFDQPQLAGMNWQPDPASRILWTCVHDGVHHKLEIESRRGVWLFWSSAGYPYLEGVDPWVYLSFELPSADPGLDTAEWKRVFAKVGRAYGKVATESLLLATASRHGAGAREWKMSGIEAEWCVINLIGLARRGKTLSWADVQAEIEWIMAHNHPKEVRSSRDAELRLQAERRDGNALYAVTKTAFILATSNTWRD